MKAHWKGNNHNDDNYDKNHDNDDKNHENYDNSIYSITIKASEGLTARQLMDLSPMLSVMARTMAMEVARIMAIPVAIPVASQNPANCCCRYQTPNNTNIIKSYKSNPV